MKFKIIPLCLLAILGFAGLSQAQEQKAPDHLKIIKGQVTNQEDSLSAPFIHIINQTSRFGTTSDENGQYKMYVQAGDTLVFSGVQFVADTVVVHELPANDRLDIALKPGTVQLDAVQINELPTEEEFKRQFIAYQPEKEEKIHIPGSYEGPRKEYSPGAGSPVSFIYNKFSKGAKERIKYAKVLEADKRYRVIKRKYNRQLVAKVTPLKEDGIDKFMVYCDFSDDFLFSSSQYDIIKEINNKLKTFEQLHPEMFETIAEKQG